MLLQRGKKKTTQKLKELNTPYTHIIHKFTSCVKKQKQLKKSSPEYLVTNTNRKKHPTLFPLCQRPKEKPEKGWIRLLKTKVSDLQRPDFNKPQISALHRCWVIRVSIFLKELDQQLLNSSLSSAEAKSFLLCSLERHGEGTYCIFTNKFRQCTVQGKILCSKAAFIFFWMLSLLRNTRSHFQLEWLREVGRDWSLFLK